MLTALQKKLLKYLGAAKKEIGGTAGPHYQFLEKLILLLGGPVITAIPVAKDLGPTYRVAAGSDTIRCYILEPQDRGGSWTIETPLNPQPSDCFSIKATDSGGARFSVTTTDGKTIDGVGTYSPAPAFNGYPGATFLYSGTEWNVIWYYAGRQSS